MAAPAGQGRTNLEEVVSVYRWIVDDVISKAKPEFVHEGVDE